MILLVLTCLKKTTPLAGRRQDTASLPVQMRLMVAKSNISKDTQTASESGALLESRISMLILKSFILKILLGFGFGLIILALL